MSSLFSVRVRNRKVDFGSYRNLCIIVGIIAVVTLLSVYRSPADIAAFLGIDNIYLFTFLFGIVGGVSAFTAAGFYTTLFSLALNGGNPFLLAVCAAPGVLIGDLAFWYVGHESREAGVRVFGTRLRTFAAWLGKKPSWFVPCIAYAYTGFTPFPGDFLMLALALINIPLKRIIIPVLLGNYTLSVLITCIASYASSLIPAFS